MISTGIHSYIVNVLSMMSTGIHSYIVNVLSMISTGIHSYIVNVLSMISTGIHSYTVNPRLYTVPINRDRTGSSRCAVCNKRKQLPSASSPGFVR